MPRPLSQLIYAIANEASNGPAVITMHDSNQFGPDVSEWGVAASPHGRVLALESYKGVFVGHNITGYTWFLGPDTAPSPIYFGDSLGEIERFLWDEVDRGNTDAPWIVGIGQGGIMAIATGLAVPERVSGIIAIDAFLPVVGGWEPPLAPLNGLPMLLLNPILHNNPHVLAGEQLRDQLNNWGATAEITQIPEVTPKTANLEAWITRHAKRFLTT